jgi:hypothetical protein
VSWISAFAVIACEPDFPQRGAATVDGALQKRLDPINRRLLLLTVAMASTESVVNRSWDCPNACEATNQMETIYEIQNPCCAVDAAAPGLDG